MSKYKIGDEVWFAEWRNGEDYITCPDCFGKKFLTVILGDGSQVTIDCAGCALGYEPPRGIVKIYTHGADARQVTITRVNTELVNGNEVSRYSFYGGYEAEEARLFDEKEDAVAASDVIGKKWVEDENKGNYIDNSRK